MIVKMIHHYGVVSVLVFDEELESRVVKTKVMQGIDVPIRCKMDHEDHVIFVSPLSSYPTLESQDEILV